MLTDPAPQAQTDEIEVAIIGCGPVGAMLANLLGLQGVSTLVLEREAAIYNLPRAVHFDDEVMRLLHGIQSVCIEALVIPANMLTTQQLSLVRRLDAPHSLRNPG